MGYRSEVAYVIEFDNVEAKEKWVSLAKLHPSHSKALKECKFVDDMDRPYITAYFQHVKWYESYDDVKTHTAMLEEIGEDEEGKVAARFIRIGEEPDDVEEEFYGDGAYDIELYVSRSIETPYQLEEVNG